MKTTIATLAIVLATGLFAGFNHAASEHLVVDHLLTGYSKGSTTLTMDYKLHVVNPGERPFFHLSLSMVPLPHLVPRGTTVNVGYLGPHQAMDVSLHVVAPALFNPLHLSRNNLFWTGKYQDSEGKEAELSVKSKPADGKS